MAGSAFLDNLDNINWLLNFYDGSNPDITWGDVQAAIWKLMGQDWTSEASYLGTVTQAHVDDLANQALAQDGYLPDAGQTLGVVVAPVAADGTLLQPLLMETKAAALGDFVFEDRNANGLQDSGDLGIAGAHVELVRDIDGDGQFTSANEVLATTRTDGTGHYSFKGLTPGLEYQVRFTLPANYEVVSPRQADGSAASGANSDGLLSNVVVLSPGESNLSLDAGFYQRASLGDRVWLDSNANGQQDQGEAGVGGVTVKLLDASGAVVATQATTDQGDYLFAGLNPGSYSVQFVQPSGYNFTTADAGIAADADLSDSDANTGTGITGSYTLGSGDNVRSADAGLVAVAQPKATIGDRVFEDRNANGVQDDGEVGVLGATIQLKDAAGNVLGSTVTDGQGRYSFNVDAGTYQLKVLVPATSGYVASAKDQGGDDAKDSDIDASGATGLITVAAGEVNNTIDMGGYRKASLGDRVWLDANANGQQDSGEAGVGGVCVNLLDAAGQVVATQNTSATGDYLFTNLKPGTYSVQFVKPEGYNFTAQDAAGTPGTQADLTDSDANTGTGITGSYTLGSGDNVRSADAGLVAVPQAKASLGNLVFEDSNYNGLQDAGEKGIGGVTVKLLNAAGGVLTSTTTDDNGAYLFSNLDAGGYKVQVTAPTGYHATQADLGSDDAKDSDIDASGTTALVTLAAGDSNTSVDAGLYRKAMLGDRVWSDANHNGLQDTGEGGVGGIKVSLLDAGGNTVNTATTDSNGAYKFVNLNPGDYQVQFDKTNVVFKPNTTASFDLNTWSWAPKDVGSNDGLDSDAAAATAKAGIATTGRVTLQSGEANTSIDAGLTPIVIDLDGNGIQTVSREQAGGHFDLFGTGHAIASGWVGSGDGLLAIDKNGNGRIDDIGELFGGSQQGAGVAQLSAMDSNGDGAVDAQDAQFGSLLVWRDANGNHATDAGELMTLGQAGLASLSLQFNALPALDEQGNLHLERGAATMADGRVVDMTDVYFNVSADDAAAAGVTLPGMAELLGDDRALDGLLGTPTATAGLGLAAHEACLGQGEAAEALRQLAALDRHELHGVAA